MLAENKRLREEVNQLNYENQQLRESLQRMRNHSTSGAGTDGAGNGAEEGGGEIKQPPASRHERDEEDALLPDIMEGGGGYGDYGGMGGKVPSIIFL